MRFLYLITRDEAPDYDEFSGMVICAEGPAAARECAKVYASDEGPQAWDEHCASVIQIGVASPDVEWGVVLADNRGS